MPETDDHFNELKRAYQVIGVPLEASAHSIKQSYRRLVKRWHPDLYANNSAAYAEASQMAKLINKAYAAIARAPLRYHTETYIQQAQKRSGPTTTTSAIEPTTIKPEDIPNVDRIEFWVRFFCGSVFGMFACLELYVSTMASPIMSAFPSSLLIALGITLGFGFGAAWFGDKFWYSIFRRWWLWP
jgi:hypothetical protein